MNYNIIIYKHFKMKFASILQYTSNLGQKYTFVVAAENSNSIIKMETFYIIYRELTLLL